MDNEWRPIATAPRDGTYILLAGPSGYTTTPLRVEVCHYNVKYQLKRPWVNHANRSFVDGGKPPTCWMPLPSKGYRRDELRIAWGQTEASCPFCGGLLNAKNTLVPGNLPEHKAVNSSGEIVGAVIPADTRPRCPYCRERLTVVLVGK